MPTSTFLLNDGTRIPVLGFGTGTALMRQEAANPTKLALEEGFVHFDTAQMYGNEDVLGGVLAECGKPRAELYVTTKIAELKERETIKSSLQGSLKRLRLDYVDLLLLHAPYYFQGRLKEAWKEMEEVQEEGLTRSIGVSNFDVEDFEQFLPEARVKPAVNQIEFHPYILGPFESVFQYTNSHGIITESYGALAPVTREQGGPLDPILEKIRSRAGEVWCKPVTPAQVLFKWLLQKGVVVVTTSSKKERMREYLDVLDMPDLTPAEIEEIDAAGKTKQPDPALPLGRYKRYLDMVVKRSKGDA
ncbi:Aldo/keto reductase [Gloeophyllum trabeum ATCC 11539]|uniref:Aldo/keto reductase n=1 Tax=Gloeophyllum trabeum (strain ATCC 11539 / FP-39264 / Madison 617) TaxID=670483 RepID=S7Q0Q2_GLOTA|nr:Aldo/keto reductase [Gloeophyllum trabeum ATCC 11539]EPQ53067.1 Aldo/keto reductase [Gloeophyllum trabeum ATCC 11539]